MWKDERSCRAVGAPAETGNTTAGEAKLFGSPHPTQAALAAMGRNPLQWGSSALFSRSGWKPPFTTSHLARFQRLMNSILSSLIHCTWGVYSADVIINPPSCGSHLKDFNEVLVGTKETGIAVKCKKVMVLRENCKFSRTLGFKRRITHRLNKVEVIKI